MPRTTKKMLEMEELYEDYGYWVLGTGYWVLGTGYWSPLYFTRIYDGLHDIVFFIVI